MSVNGLLEIQVKWGNYDIWWIRSPIFPHHISTYSPRLSTLISSIAPHYTTLHHIALHHIALHRIALHCIALHCIALHCIALHCIALHCIALHCIASHCTASHRIALHRIALHCIASHCIALHRIALHRIALHRIALHCIACDSRISTLLPVHLDYFWCLVIGIPSYLQNASPYLCNNVSSSSYMW